MKTLAQAVLKCMEEIRGLEKDMSVGSGNFSYKGVSDYEVKKLYKPIFQKNGLVLLPTGVSAKTEVSRWEETNNYGTKSKQSVFTEVETKYLLLHESGESIELAGYGQGVDAQDKGAGKATTYALKYTLLYLGLTPTGAIDDSDNTHSDDIPIEPTQKKPKALDKLVKDSEDWKKILGFLEAGKLTRLEQITNQFVVSEDLKRDINRLIAEKSKPTEAETEKPKSVLKNLTKEIYDKAIICKTKASVLKILSEYAMSEDSKKGLTDYMKGLKK